MTLADISIPYGLVKGDLINLVRDLAEADSHLEWCSKREEKAARELASARRSLKSAQASRDRAAANLWGRVRKSTGGDSK